MNRTMFDGLNTDAKFIRNIIKPGELVAYYIDGLYAWSAEEIAMFPDNQHVTITVLGNPADGADCETGDMTPESAANWVRQRKAAGYFRPTIYRSLSGMPDIRATTGDLIMGKDWDAWVADYDNSTSSVYPGSIAKQYRSVNDYDVSVVFDDAWPHRVKSQPTAPILNPKWPAGMILSFGNRGNAVEALQRALSTSGIYGVRGITPDGIFGQQTQTAVRNFESSEHLSLDSGVAGSHVRNELILLGLLNSAGQATK